MTLAVVGGVILLVLLSMVGLATFLSTTQLSSDSFELRLAPGAAEARYIGAHQQGSILTGELRVRGEGEGEPILVICNRTTFMDWAAELEEGTDHGDMPDDISGSMLYEDEGGGDGLEVRLSDERLLIGAFNPGPGNITLEVDYEVDTQPQWICFGFIIPVLLLAAVAGAAALGGLRLNGDDGGRDFRAGMPPPPPPPEHAYRRGGEYPQYRGTGPPSPPPPHPPPPPPILLPHSPSQSPSHPPPPPGAQVWPCLSCDAPLAPDGYGGWHCPRCGRRY
jgi:hypothetical protein